MTIYTYQAIDTSGKNLDGTVDALSLQAAREAVITLGLEPIEIYEAEASAGPSPELAYFPLLETLRLYAGWLLAWYAIVYAVGSYQFMKDVPFHIPYAESLFLSPLVLSFTFAAYLFLLLTGIYKMTGRSKKIGIVLFITGVAIFLLYKMNTQ